MGLSAGQIALDTDFATIQAGSSGKPILRLVATAVQSIPDTTITAINFATEQIDTHGFFNSVTSTSQVKPTLPGYYRLHGSVFFGGLLTYVTVSIFFRKNGSTAVPPGGRMGGLGYQGSPASSPTAQVAGVHTTCLVDFDGATDYIELAVSMDNTGNTAQNTNQSGQYTCVLELEYVRSL